MPVPHKRTLYDILDINSGYIQDVYRKKQLIVSILNPFIFLGSPVRCEGVSSKHEHGPDQSN